MKKAYYLFNPGRLSRRDQTLCFDPVSDVESPTLPRRYLPVNGVSALYVFGSLDANSALYNFLGQQGIPVHFFDYYHHYTGSYQPRASLLAGQMVVTQVQHYLSKKKRLIIARTLVEVAIFNMIKNLRYYQNRGKALDKIISYLDTMRLQPETCINIGQLMGVEGASRQAYYEAFDVIIDDFAWNGRRKHPPVDEINALVSFGNSLCYTACLDGLYNSQLDPTISYLHEPGYRRFSLALDMAEVFKPLLVDRLIFKVCNRKIIRSEHFDVIDDACFLSERGRKVFVQQWEERLQQTIQHRKLNREVSYRHLIRLDCYKLSKYLLGMESSFEPFKTWW